MNSFSRRLSTTLRSAWTGIAFAAAGLSVATGAAAQAKYVVTDLGSLDGSIGTTIAQGINNAGQVVGYTRLGASFTAPSRAFRTAPNQAIQPADNLGTLGGASSFAYAINAAGQVVGDADTAMPGPFGSVVTRAFRADPGQPMIDLGTLAPNGGIGGRNNSGARGINDQAVVVGLATVPNNTCVAVSHAFRTAPGATINPATDDLGTLVPASFGCPAAGSRSSIAWGVNNVGTVVGRAATTFQAGSPNRAFRFAGSGPIENLGVLALGPDSSAVAINDRGEAVGESDFNGQPFTIMKRAFLKAGNNPLQDLGDLGAGWAVATAINTPLSGGASHVVGHSGTQFGGSRAFLWDAVLLVDLNARTTFNSPWEITFARGINGRGQIVADAQKDGVAFVYHAVRLDPSDVATDILLASLSDPTLALTRGQTNALNDKLTNALLSIQTGLNIPYLQIGQNKQAINQLNAFVSAVQTQWKVGKMSSATAATLTAAAKAIIATLIL